MATASRKRKQEDSSSDGGYSPRIYYKTGTTSSTRERSRNPLSRTKKKSPSSCTTHRKYKHKKNQREEPKTRKESDSRTKSSKRNREKEERRRENHKSTSKCMSSEGRYVITSSEHRTAFIENAKEKIPKKERKRSHENVKDSESSYKPPERNIKVSSRLQREIEDILRTERHHVIWKSQDRLDRSIHYVQWCYYYLDPKLPGHITGGRAHLHHFCRVCKRTCLHLLGKYGTGSRKCLSCAAKEMGWKEEEVPSWYFHGTCKHCRNDPKRRQYIHRWYDRVK